jgi:hypothetical protein
MERLIKIYEIIMRGINGWNYWYEYKKEG